MWKAACALGPCATAEASSSTSKNVNKIMVLKGVSLRNVSVRQSGEVTYDLDI